MMTYNKYRAETFRIFGLVFMTPFGKLVLDFPNFRFNSISLQSVAYFIFSLILVYFGIILVLKGFETLGN